MSKMSDLSLYIEEMILKNMDVDEIISILRSEYELSYEVAENWIYDVEADLTMREEKSYWQFEQPIEGDENENSY
jgi:hypothetical protein